MAAIFSASAAGSLASLLEGKSLAVGGTLLDLIKKMRVITATNAKMKIKIMDRKPGIEIWLSEIKKIRF